MNLPEPDIQRLAVELVLHFHKTPSQASRICGCGISAVQRYVAEYVRQQSHEDGDHLDTGVPTSFVPVLLDDESIPVPSTFVPLDILTANGLTLRLQLPSLRDVALLLRELEVETC